MGNSGSVTATRAAFAISYSPYPIPYNSASRSFGTGST
jgi:hypothetical protein